VLKGGGGKDKRKASGSSMLRLRTMCYIEPVLAFGTEQDIIVNSRRLSPQRSKDQAVR
jgi:hypothetical protein